MSSDASPSTKSCCLKKSEFLVEGCVSVDKGQGGGSDGFKEGDHVKVTPLYNMVVIYALS